MTAEKQFSVLQFTLLTLLGWIAGIPLLLALAGISGSLKMSGEWAVGSGMALGVACLQWMALRHHFAHSLRWIYTTVAGMSAAWMVSDTLRYFFHFEAGNQVLPATLVGAAMAGWLQWKFLLQHKIPRAFNWIAVSVVAWGLATLVVYPLSFYNRLHLPDWIELPLAFGTLFSGGVVLGWLSGFWLKKWAK